VITGHLYDDDTPERDQRARRRAQDELDRQFTRCDILNKEMQRKAMMGGIEQVKEQLEDLKARQEGRGAAGTGLSPSSSAREALLAGEARLQNGDQQIKRC
jgi:hypothetical protein